MKSVPVVKMHGTRNAFVVLDAREHNVPDIVTFARRMCAPGSSTHGADGLLVILPSHSQTARMRVINADGSEAEMCGNGVRCVARYLAEHDALEDARIETLAGPISTHVSGRDPFQVRVGMGPVTLQPRATIVAAGETLVYRPVSVGNPHAVTFVDDLAQVDLPRLGPAVSTHPAFAHGTNAHFAQVLDRSTIRVLHWERGAGPTAACGTGAVAVAAAAIDEERVTSPVRVQVPGGELLVEWAPGGEAIMTGPAEREFERLVEA